MTREEAKEILTHNWTRVDNPNYSESELDEAFFMAIEALQTDLVRCKDCRQKHIGGSVTHYYWCDLWDREVDDTDYCAWGERREP